MDRAGDKLLSRPGLSLDQHRRINPRHVADLLVDKLHGFTLAQEIVKLRPLVEQAAQVMNFSDIIKKENLAACIPRIVLDIYFEPMRWLSVRSK